MHPVVRRKTEIITIFKVNCFYLVTPSQNLSTFSLFYLKDNLEFTLVSNKYGNYCKFVAKKLFCKAGDSVHVSVEKGKEEDERRSR